MGLSRRKFTKELKLAAVRRLELGVSIAEAARALAAGVSAWPRQRLSGESKARWSEGRIAELKRKVGQQTLEIRRTHKYPPSHRRTLLASIRSAAQLQDR
jgi:transposase